MVVTRRYLVVANQTLQRAELRDELRNRAEAEPSSFYLLAPDTPAAEYPDVPAAADVRESLAPLAMARISSAGGLDVADGIRTAPSGVNSDAKRSWSHIITASVNSPRIASISTRSAVA